MNLQRAVALRGVSRDRPVKSPAMVGLFLVLWALTLVVFGPRLWLVVMTSSTVFEAVLLVAFCLMLTVFWMLTAYYVAVMVFALRSKPLGAPTQMRDAQWAEVAILYPTCNDFQLEAASSCLNQDYPGMHLFLLDDSSKEEYRAQVDAFHAAHPEKTTVVRRETRVGFKAGNLNHALRGAAAGYAFFAVMDADERVPPDFLRRTMAHMMASDVAFVQANHAPNPDQASAFARDIAPTILPFWDIHCRPRNRHGIVLYLGHGAVVRRSSWEAVGGFPEVVLEDLAFSAVLGAHGLRGAFLDDLLCYEDFPENYLAFKRQHERYVIGTTQVMHRYLGGLLRSKRLSITEKIDFCLWCSPLYVPALCMLFAVLCSVGLAGVLGSWSPLTVSVLGHQVVVPAVRILDERFASLWSLDFQLFSVVSAFAPAFACLALGIKGRLRPIRLLFLSTVPYLSVMLVSWRGILGYLLRGRTFSPPTGEKVTYLRHKPGPGASGVHRPLPTPGSAFVWRTPKAWELAVGGLLAYASLMSFNIALFAVCCCLLLGVWIEIAGWESRPVRIASTGCFAAILLQVLMNLVLQGAAPGLVPLVFSVHF